MGCYTTTWLKSKTLEVVIRYKRDCQSVHSTRVEQPHSERQTSQIWTDCCVKQDKLKQYCLWIYSKSWVRNWERRFPRETLLQNTHGGPRKVDQLFVPSTKIVYARSLQTTMGVICQRSDPDRHNGLSPIEPHRYHLSRSLPCTVHELPSPPTLGFEPCAPLLASNWSPIDPRFDTRLHELDEQFEIHQILLIYQNKTTPNSDTLDSTP